MFTKQKILITPEQYINQERASHFKSEYLNGEIYAMAGSSREHNQIASNIVIELGGKLRNSPCSIYFSDMKVKIAAIKKYTYPDIIISCDQQLFEDNDNDILLNPIVIIEILSDSTEAYDRGLKFFHYRLIDSFKEYILVSQKFCQVEHFLRQENNQWIYSAFHTMTDNLMIHSFNCILSLQEIYRRVALQID
ncbi:Uma2 domain-containing protein [Gammaproteobacteria bacterium]